MSISVLDAELLLVWVLCVYVCVSYIVRLYGDGSQLKVSSDRLEKPGIEAGAPWYKASDLSPTPWRLLREVLTLLLATH